MPVAGRRGVTLLELLVAMVAAAFLGLLVLRASATVTAVLRNRVERVGAEVAARAVWGVIRFDWASFGSDSVAGPDLGTLTAGAVTYRADRGLVSVCRLVPDTVVIASTRLVRWVARRPVAGRDSLLLYAPGDSAAGIDAWVPVPLLAGPYVGTCPSGAPGDRFTTSLDSGTVARRRLRSPVVARLVETVGARIYGAGTLWQFGIEGLSAGASIQPVASNLAGPTGLQISGWDCGGLAGSLASLCGADVELRVMTKRDLGLGAGRGPVGLDSLSMSVRFENRP